MTATHQVRKAVADLRSRIPNGSDFIVTEGQGYRAVLDGAGLDLVEFGDRTGEADRAVAEGRPSDAIAALQGALALWRGRMSGLGSDALEAAAARLEERRVTAAEQVFELCLRAGHSGGLVADLRDLAAQHPFRESLYAQLMLALYRSGRKAEALDEYRKMRELLVEELGIDPGPQLSGLYEAILREAPELSLPGEAVTDAPEPAAADADTPEPAFSPCTLPYDLSDFTGREDELQSLLDCMITGQETRGHSPVVAIDGMGGSGKTCLAVRAAHRVAGEFPDGQLHIDLRAFTPGESPMAPAAALDSLLGVLGVPSDRIPGDLEGRRALWRSLLADRRMLLVLDNAVDTSQVYPLLPGSPGCLVLITGRTRLMDLDGAKWISIGPMAPENGMQLIEEVLGASRTAAEPEAVQHLVRLCGGLPLALRIAAARLRNRPRWTVRYLVERLCDETRRLRELSAGERSVAATLQLSYQAMDEEHRTSLRLLGLYGDAGIDVYTGAALLATDIYGAEQILERLLDVHLLQQSHIAVYRFHDLVRDFARSLSSPATAHDDSTAVERLLGYYWKATEAACEVLFPGRTRSQAVIAPYTGEVPVFTTAAEATDWFNRERASLIAAVELADRHGLDEYTVWLTRNIVFWLNSAGRFEEFKRLSRLAVATARRSSDLAALGSSLSSLGVACWRLGHLEEGIRSAEEGRDVAVRLGDRRTESHSESMIGLLLTVQGRHAEALSHLERALDLERELGLPRAEAESLSNLSTLLMQWGRYEEAAAAARQALEIHRSLDYRDNHVMALTDLAFAHAGQGRYEEADEQLGLARARCDTSSPPGDVALTLALSAEVLECLGRSAEAPSLAEEALQFAELSDSPTRQAKVENLVGRLYRRRGDFERAMALHTHAHELAVAMRYRTEEAHALYGMAEAAAAFGDAKAASHHAAEAEELLRSMDSTGHAAWCLIG
ncbi:AfsR/SARP family transcriptional regulator [Streptomyces africanus]|uniref:AfsR/SARP family transcriptional regulator n=1 Tax=Streptomyces africanus TaxID=231024 RepID=UPI001FCA2AE9|nr:BTAD domain-containing putative transcriptional regulator [Streptomyces africanus]